MTPDLPDAYRRFLDKGKALAEQLDFELTDEAKDSLDGYLVHWSSQTFAIVVKDGKGSPLGVPAMLDGEYVNIIHARHTGQLREGYIIIGCQYQHET